MPRNGSGIYSLPAGYLASTGGTIVISQHNPIFEDVESEITASLPRSGTAAMTGNLKMGSNSITGGAAGSALTDYPIIDQVQDDSLKYAAIAGTDTYTVTYSPNPSSLTTGMILTGKVTNANTGAATLNPNSIGATPIKKVTSASVTAALVANDILAGQFCQFQYDGTNFVLLNPATDLAAGGDALTTDPLSQFAATTSAQLAGVISDETGSGALVFATSPTLVTPALGTPSAGVLTNCTGTASGLTAGNISTSASEGTAGKVELATTAEIDTATDTGRAICPDQFNASDWGLTYAELTAIQPTTDATTGDGKVYFVTPSALAGYDLVEVQADCITAGVTDTMDVQIHNVTQAQDILSTKLTIDSNETSSRTAVDAAVINTAQDDITLGDVLRIDVDAIHSGTAAKGLIVIMGFRKP